MTQNNLLLKKCLKEIERKLNWIDSAQWQQKHFESLSDLIFEKTKVNLSPLTLKRLWGKVNYESNPSINTLDALAKFIDYPNWIEYQSKQKGNKTISIRLAYHRHKKLLFGVGFILIAAVVTLLSLQLIPIPITKNYSDYTFSIQPLSSGLPNTVYFHYDVKNTEADSVSIQQSWDSRLRHLVPKNKTDYSCIYYYPGYYRAKLLLDNQVVAEEDLYIKSDGWRGIIHNDPVPFYLTPERMHRKNGALAIDEDDLIEAGFDMKKALPLSTINLVEDFGGIQATNFELQASFKQTYPKGEAICEQSAVMILCSDGYFQLPFSILGCVNKLQMLLPQKTINASDTNLSALGIETSETVNLHLTVHDGILDLQVNDHPGFTDTLTTDPGKLVGFKFGFNGTGELYSFLLKSDEESYEMADFMP